MVRKAGREMHAIAGASVRAHAQKCVWMI